MTDNKITGNKYCNKNIYCGIDFGTSNSVISITDAESLNEIFTYSDKSVLYYQKEGNTVFIGEEAQCKYVEEIMNGRLLKSIKTLLPQKDFMFTVINGKKVTPDQMVTHILRHLKEKAEEVLDFNIETVTIGRPAIFSKDPKKEETAKNRLVQAAKNAGFINITLQLEPIAAALSYEKNIKDKEKVLIADIGGGTSDFTLANLSPQKIGVSDRSNDIICNSGVYIGGDTFDSEIMWHKVTPMLGRGVQYKGADALLDIPNTLYRELRNWEKSFLLKDCKARRNIDKYYVFSGYNDKINNVRLLIDNNGTYSLFQEIEKAKIKLSSHQESDIIFTKFNMNLVTKLAYEEYKLTIKKHLDSIESCVNEILDNSKCDIKDIDKLVLTGGSSLSRPIIDLFTNIFGKNKIYYNDVFHSVAYGLSLANI